MGFINPAPPPVDVEEWKKQPHLLKIKPLAQDWAVNGFGTPYVIYLVYVVKLVLFCWLAVLAISTTSGLGGVSDFSDWWTEPIVWQKVVVFMVCWEFLGLGSSSMALSFRFIPPIGGPLYWLRPGTLRLPPWPGKVPFTKGTTRTPVDVLLALGVYVMAFYLLFSDGEAFAGTAAGRLDPTAIAILLGFIVALGLRDKVSYLSTRPELYGVLLVVFLFPLHNMIIASQLVLFFIWFGAALSKLSHHFPYVVTVMVSNTPWNRSRKAKAMLYESHPEVLKPSRQAVVFAHVGTVMEFGLPAVMLASDGGTIGWAAVIGMLIFHAHITSTFPLAVPLEWNLFMMFGAVYLFGHYGDVSWSTLDNPLLIAIVLTSGLLVPILGNMRPDLISFLPSMRYYAGNWATSWWLFNKDRGIEERFDKDIKKSSPLVVTQLTKLYDRDAAELTLYKALAFRSMHCHGRAMNALLPKAVDDVEAYHVREGEFMAGATIGWNFGDGHFHGKQLLEAVQERLNLDEGDLRILTMESQPIHIQRQRYRIYDAKTGLVEEGWADIKDMRERLPWLDDNWGSFPFEVTYRAPSADTASKPAGSAPIPA
jgi:hypothetical protein